MRENAGFTIMAREKTVMSGSGSGLEFKDMTVFTIKPKSRSLNEERPEAGLREFYSQIRLNVTETDALTSRSPA